jgi:hypothetical protein
MSYCACALAQNRITAETYYAIHQRQETRFGRVEYELIEIAQPCGTNDSTASSCIGLNKTWYDDDGDRR